MCAGSGLQHSEMFPLVHRTRGNPLRLYQLWLNLPAKDKRADPCFIMAWAEDIHTLPGEGGASARLYAGKLGAASSGVVPPPRSWGADPANDGA